MVWPKKKKFLKALAKHLMGFPGGSDGKESACNAGDLGSIPRLGRCPGERNGYPLQYSGESNGQRSLVDYSPWGCLESDMTKQLSHKHLTDLTSSSLSRQ